MSNFTEAKTGGWSDGEQITGAQITKLQQQQLKSVNGDEGSNHVGTVGFGGLNVTGATHLVGASVVDDLRGTVKVGQILAVPGTLSVTGEADFLGGDVNMTGDVTLTNVLVQDLEVAGDFSVDLAGTCDVKCDATFERKIVHVESITHFIQEADYDSAKWLPKQSGAGLRGGYTALTANADVITVPIKLPDGSTLNSVTLAIMGSGGHAALPATMPNLKIWKTVVSSNTTTQIGATATDASASTPVYQAVHAITAPSLATVVSKGTTIYWAEVTNEGGANAQGGLSFIASVNFTTASVDYGAA